MDLPASHPHRSPTVRRINRRAALILPAVAIALATLLGLAASQTAQAAPAATPQPTYSLHDGYWVLRDFGVPGTEDQMRVLLLDTCGRMSNDQAAMLALQKQLSIPFPGNGGDIMAIASDVFCPQFGGALRTLAASEIGH